MSQNQPTSLRFYIRASGCRLWCVPIRAVIGQSIETYCNGRSSQSDPVELATEPSIWERCTVCELAANSAIVEGAVELLDRLPGSVDERAKSRILLEALIKCLSR